LAIGDQSNINPLTAKSDIKVLRLLAVAVAQAKSSKITSIFLKRGKLATK